MRKLLGFFVFSTMALAQSAGVGQIWTLLGPTTLQNGATANGNGTAMAVGGMATATFSVNCSVTCSGGTTVNFEGSDASTNWSALSAVQVGTATVATSVANQGSGSVTFWQVPIGGFVNIRARISGYSAGTITVTATAAVADYSPKVVNANLFAGGTAVDGNSGSKSAQTLRVVLATDQPQLTNKLLVTPDTNSAVNVGQINGVTPLMGNGVTGTGSQRVTIASDNTAFSVNATLSAETTKVIGTARIIGNGGATLDSAPAATAPTNVLQVGGTFTTTPTTLTTGQAGALQLTAAQNLKVDHTTIAGTAVDTNSGNKSAGTQRVVIATDQPNLTTALNTNTAQINGVTVLMGNGVTGTGSQRVTIASDNTAFSVNATLSAETTKVIGTARIIGNGGATLDSAPAATAPTNVLQVGGTFTTTPATLTTGQAGAIQLTAAQNLKTDMTTVAGTVVDTNSGNKSAGTQRVVLATDQPNLTTALNVNTAQINGVTVLMGNGTTGTGSQRVTIASDNTAFTVNAAESGTWTVQPGNTANTTPWLTAHATEATTANSALTSYLTSAASTNSTSVKGSAGNVYGISAINTTATLYYLRMYNSSSAPTCSSATGFIESIPIPASATGAGVEIWPSVPQGYTTGIGFCLTGGGSSTDNTNAATGIYLRLLYK